MNERLVLFLVALVIEQAKRTTTGGLPAGYHLPGAWTNPTLPPPPSANDPTAPPHKRRTR